MIQGYKTLDLQVLTETNVNGLDVLNESSVRWSEYLLMSKCFSSVKIKNVFAFR